MSSEIAISMRNLSKVYRIYEKPEDRLIQMATIGRVRRFTEFPALSDISLDVRRGETIGIVGRNGCGKSTLLQIICGTLQPTGGELTVNGRIAALLELGAGFNSEFTGRENVYMNGAILGFSREEMDARFDDIARFASIGAFIERPVKTYSSGMFVRLAFAVATAVDPDILVIDEALSVGDEAFQRKCFARIEAIKERGGTILFVSHGAQTIIQLCDRVVLLDAGEKLLEGEPKIVVGQYQRLINASQDAAAEIRASITALGPGGAQMSEPSLLALEDPEADDDIDLRPDPVVVSDGALSQGPLIADYFDAGLAAQSTISLEERGARISDIRLTTLEHDTINVLQMGKTYLLQYTVDFLADAREVGFGMTVKTVSGNQIAGMHTSRAKESRLSSVSKGDTICNQFEFICALVPATYFISCGVRGAVEEEEVVLHRIVDALAFRVAPESGLLATGWVDLNVVHRRSEGTAK